MRQVSTTRRSGNLAKTAPSQEQDVTSQARPNGRKLIAVRASEIIPEEIRWLWYPYIPAGMLTMLEGDPGLGKSMITCSLAADISQGRPLPGMQTQGYPPQKVLMMSQEDSMQHTIYQRLMKHDANMENVYVNNQLFALDNEGLLELEQLMREVVATIVFLDPLVGYFGGKLDINRANETRAQMGPLVEISKRTGCAIVSVRHLRKQEGTNAKYRGLGSIDLIGVVRSGLQVGEREDGSHFMEHVKHNLSPKGPTLNYEVNEGKIEWRGIAVPPPAKVSKVPARLAEAQALLAEILTDGPLPSTQVLHRARAHGISESTLIRAKNGVATSYKLGTGEWMWDLVERQRVRPISIGANTDTSDPALTLILEQARHKLAGKESGPPQ